MESQSINYQCCICSRTREYPCETNQPTVIYDACQCCGSDLVKIGISSPEKVEKENAACAV